ncbi:hypothetical protein OROGR_012248 [Orobanche gracilis]
MLTWGYRFDLGARTQGDGVGFARHPRVDSVRTRGCDWRVPVSAKIKGV